MATEAEAVTETPVVEEPKKDVKEKKPKATKEKKPKQPKTASHPPYIQMIKEALSALNEKSGSSPYAIAKYMEEKHKSVLPSNFRKILAVQLKNFASKGKLIKIRASDKLSETGKKDKQPAPTKKPKAPKTTALKKTRSATAAAAGGAVGASKKKAKISTPAKPKQPKSIKSPAAKRAKKTAA